MPDRWGSHSSRMGSEWLEGREESLMKDNSTNNSKGKHFFFLKAHHTFYTLPSVFLPCRGLELCWARLRCSSLSRWRGWCWAISTLVHTLLSPCTKKVKAQDRCSLHGKSKTKRDIGSFREICPHSPSNPHNIKEKNKTTTLDLKLHFAIDTQKLMGTPLG